MYYPWYLAIGSACLIIMSRLLLSWAVVLAGSSQKVDKFFKIPIFLGYLGMLCSFFWAFSIAWWAPGLVFLLLVVVLFLLRYEVAESLLMSGNQRKQLANIVIREEFESMMQGEKRVDAGILDLVQAIEGEQSLKEKNK